MPYIYGRNPVTEALEHGEPVQKIYVQFGSKNERVQKIYTLARQQNISIVTADNRKLKQMVGNATHQGVVALISPIELIPLEKYLENTDVEGDQCLVLIDRIQDPHNLGAIIRSAEILGAKGLIISQRDNVPITDTVMKASSGAAFHLPIYQTESLFRAIRQLQDFGFRILGAMLQDEATPIWETNFSGDCAIIIGGEAKGIQPEAAERCDTLFYIPQSGKTQSLNASVAAGIVLAEVARQRNSG
ncbi:MAG: 23S rRNA (guanosine(2251)-2'-O)-methyltransferase RlmB [Calditrichota bacterium]